jgi:hypothetical protein
MGPNGTGYDDGIGSGLCLVKECGISDVAPSNFSTRKLLDKNRI